MYYSTLGWRVIKKKKSWLDRVGFVERTGRGLQRYLAHKKQPLPKGHHRALGIVLM